MIRMTALQDYPATPNEIAGHIFGTQLRFWRVCTTAAAQMPMRQMKALEHAAKTQARLMKIGAAVLQTAAEAPAPEDRPAEFQSRARAAAPAAKPAASKPARKAAAAEQAKPASAKAPARKAPAKK